MQVLFALKAEDYKHTTLLMHAASVGPAPVFYEVQSAVILAFGNDEASYSTTRNCDSSTRGNLLLKRHNPIAGSDRNTGISIETCYFDHNEPLLSSSCTIV